MRVVRLDPSLYWMLHTLTGELAHKTGIGESHGAWMILNVDGQCRYGTGCRPLGFRPLVRFGRSLYKKHSTACILPSSSLGFGPKGFCNARQIRMALNKGMNGDLTASGNVRTPMKSGLATISGRESCTGAKHFDDANMAESPIEITACYHEFGSKLIFWFWGICPEIID